MFCYTITNSVSLFTRTQCMDRKASYDEESAKYCDLMITTPNVENNTRCSLALIPHKESTSESNDKQYRKFVITSVVCNLDQNVTTTERYDNFNELICSGKELNDSNRLIIAHTTPNSRNNIESFSISTTTENKSLKLQTGLKNRRSIVRTKKKKAAKSVQEYSF